MSLSRVRDYFDLLGIVRCETTAVFGVVMHDRRRIGRRQVPAWPDLNSALEKVE
jgi:hypothetical protein